MVSIKIPIGLSVRKSEKAQGADMRPTKKPGRPRIEVQKPMLRAKIIEAYGETGSLERTAFRVGVAPNTVKAVLMRHPEDFAAAKKRWRRGCLLLRIRAVEITGERLDECSAPQAAVVAGKSD